MQVDHGDVLVGYVFLDPVNTPTSIMFQWEATDGTGLSHRAYWGANSFVHGVNGTPSRWFMGALPATNQWVRLEVPASVVDMEGRVANGGIFSVFGGVCSFDQFGKYPGRIQQAEAVITTPVEEQETPAEEQETPVEEQETPVEQQEIPVEEEETPAEPAEFQLEPIPNEAAEEEPEQLPETIPAPASTNWRGSIGPC